MIIAGTRLTATEISTLARKLRHAGMSDCADRVERTYNDDERLFAISPDERAAFYEALDDCPDELLPLRTSLGEQLV